MTARSRAPALALALLSSLATLSANAQRLPSCAPAHVDPALLAELVTIELGTDAPIEIELDASLCDAAARQLGFVVRDRSDRTSARDVITVPPSADLAARTRALALALVERARLALATARRMRAPPRPAAPREVPRVELGLPVAPATGPRLELGAAAVGRLAPISGTAALGGRIELGAQLDGAWTLRADLGASWSRGGTSEGDVDAALVALGLAAGGVLARATSLELALLARGELGVVHATGTRHDGAGARTTTAPWCTLGAVLDLAWWLAPSVALTAALGADAVLAGIDIVETSGRALSLSYVTLSLALGIRTAL